MGEVVARVDHQIRLQARQQRHPLPSSPILRGQVQIGDLQEADRRSPPRQDRDRDPPEGEGVDLVQRPVRKTTRPERERSGGNLRDAATCSRHEEKGTSAADARTGTARLERMAEDSALKQRLRNDLTAAIKGRDKVRSGTLRMVLSAVTEAEVAGATAIDLSDAQVLDVVIREAKKRREAEEAYAAAGRDELAAQERAENAVLADYLPQPLTPEEITQIVADAIVRTSAAELGPRGDREGDGGG